MNKISLLILITIFLVGCSSGAPTPSAPSESDIQTAIAQTRAAQPATEVVIPTATLTEDLFKLTMQAGQTQNAAHAETAAAYPTNTLQPDTPTPAPTDTPQQEAPTPEPTDTQEDFGSSSEPSFSGSGDDVIDIETSYEITILWVEGNEGGDYFGVKNYDRNGEMIDLLVSVTEPYRGLVPLDLGSDERTTRLEVTAVGGWHMEILPAEAGPTLIVPGHFEGIGDTVLLLTGGTPDTAEVSGNATSDYFSIKSFSENGEWIDLNISTTDPYDGKIILDSETTYLAISATGPWQIFTSGN